MGNKVFSGIAWVAIQGDRVLRFVNCTQDRAVYEIIGFEAVNFTLIDYRIAGIQAIQRTLNTGDLVSFAPSFNMVSQVDIWETDDGGLTIELSDPNDSIPEHVLWIAIGIGNSVPVYDYVLEYFSPLPLDENHFAFLSIYKLSAHGLSSAKSINSSSASSSGPWDG